MADIQDEKADIRIEEETSRTQAIIEQYEGKKGKAILRKVCVAPHFPTTHTLY